jgi:hypothetical protein
MQRSIRKKQKSRKNYLNGKDINKRVERYLGETVNNVDTDTIYRFPGIICPDRLFTQLEYSFGSYFINNASISGTLLVAGNSPYDPDKTSGTSQPIGFVSWSAFYGRYRVRRSRVLIIAASATQPYRLSCTPTTDTSLPSSVDQSLCLPYYSGYTLGTSLQKSYVDTSMETAKIYGVTGIDQQSGFSAATSADPTSLWYWRIRTTTFDGATAANIYVQVVVIYEVEFYQRLNLVSGT